MVCTNTNCRLQGFSATQILLVFSTFLATTAYAAVLDVVGENKAQDSAKGNDNVVGLLDPVLRLNRMTFDQTILEEHADPVSHWIVLFCPPWYEPCQALEPVFKALTQKWEEQLNSPLFSTEVRFAAVDCATEKALCNQQNVNTYPFVAHYRERKQVGTWRGKSFDTDAKRLRDYLQKELGPVHAKLLAATGTKVAPSPPVLVKTVFACPSVGASFGTKGSAEECANAVEASGGKFFIFGKGINAGKCYKEDTFSVDCTEGVERDFYDFYKIEGAASYMQEDETPEGGANIPVDFLLIFAAIAGNAFFISRGSFGSEASSTPASATKLPIGGVLLPSESQAEQRSSCVARSLPKEWSEARRSVEL